VIQRVSFEGHDAVQLHGATTDVVVTVDVGPRILGLLAGGDNLFAVLPGAGLPLPGGERFTMYGGHRLWAAPEEPTVTYQPDDRPCDVGEVEDGLRIWAPPDGSGLRKALVIRAAGRGWVVDHELTNEGVAPRTFAPWAISQCTPGGTAALALGGESEGLQADRAVVLWPYTDPSDERISWSRDEILLDAPLAGAPMKLGVAPGGGTVAYEWNGWRFEKAIGTQADAPHADRGAAIQVYVCDRFCELETLGPLRTVQPGATADHRERWTIDRVGGDA
jgi:hypothetical protein